MATKSFLSAR